ncbi:hypothetical protein R0J90_21190, partial [Micrococcus sp. SIMBA_144]
TERGVVGGVAHAPPARRLGLSAGSAGPAEAAQGATVLAHVQVPARAEPLAQTDATPGVTLLVPARRPRGQAQGPGPGTKQ